MDILSQLREGLASSSAEETESIGTRLGAALPDNSALALSGQLGTGKTTLVRGIARGLGIHGSVTSPTYNIYTIYQGMRQLVHMDAYRLGSSQDLESLTLEEFFHPPYLLVVEWPERVPSLFEEYPTTWLNLTIDPDYRHRIRLLQG